MSIIKYVFFFFPLFWVDNGVYIKCMAISWGQRDTILEVLIWMILFQEFRK
jgi:hypothetical protein